MSNADLSNEAFPFSSHKVISIAGHKVRALRLTFVGELGWELHIPKESCVPVYEAIMDAGAQYGIADAGERNITLFSHERRPTRLSFDYLLQHVFFISRMALNMEMLSQQLCH